jgi:predicted nucleic acid-binding protein
MNPQEAEMALRSNFSHARTADLSAECAWAAIRETTAKGFRGGRVFDAAIAWAAWEAGATVLLTWNAKHFQTVAPAGLEIREP